MQHAFGRQKGAHEFGLIPKMKRPLGKSSLDASVTLKWALSKSRPSSPTV